jgi:nicotinate-nucleotide pyrophosphorylase (carboxylating)
MDLRELVTAALKEDIESGDITTELTVPETFLGTARVISKSAGIIAGLAAFSEVYRQVDESLQVETDFRDGDSVAPGDDVIVLSGALASILKGERTALNFLGRLSGIATLTAQFVNRVEGTGAVILDTRKTTPLMRHLEKEAVCSGGGANHRFGLYDMVLVKDNHVAAAGGIDKALTRIDANLKLGILVEVEVQSLSQLDVVLKHHVDRILLDNFSLETIQKAVKKVAGRIPLEVSGGITLENVGDIASTGVEFISVGALTHSPPNFDFSLRIDEQQ